MTGAIRHAPADLTLSAGRSRFGHVHTSGSGPSSGRHGRAGCGSSIVLMPLRHGQALDTAVAALGLELTSVWASARNDTRLTTALAGRDPDAPEEASRTVRADFLRLLALGVAPSRAELILGVPSTSGWRSDPAFAKACDAVSSAAAPYAHTRQNRLTPERVARFREALRTPGTTVLAAAAAAAIGVTTLAIYQRRHRDAEFAKAMDAAPPAR
ncbi:hypothetical protein [Streptomyces sp. NBC_00268]|uniref:hypothetical protein n=1 Tax=Streptomyces sp. NBC_00268 TaxID=2975695 RepID=UPI0022518930|nr:hypothetical protein [Streptomyces sp. NBC_00268]MCX5182598.1 hypothetical protein [Streptomyces sp. NBC_00268]